MGKGREGYATEYITLVQEQYQVHLGEELIRADRFPQEDAIFLYIGACEVS